MRFVCLFALVVVLAGCGKSEYELAPVEGTLTLAGKPLMMSKIMFAPVGKGTGTNAGRPAIGSINEGGRFVLSTFKEGDGAIVGEHWVTVYAPEKSSGASPIKSPDGRAIERVSVPRKVAVVAGQNNQIDIELTPQELTKFAQWSD